MIGTAKESTGMNDKIANAINEPVSQAKGRGRPRSKPDSKLASFYLPIELIARIDSESIKVSAGNKSMFLIMLIEDYFRNKKTQP